MSTSRAEIRFRSADRAQTLAVSLEDLLPEDHPARLVVRFAEGLDYTLLHAAIQARTDRPGAPVFRPEVLLALWLLATIEGIASARRLARFCRRDVAYRWICGGPAPSYHTLSTFYAEHEAFLDATFVESLAALTASGLLAVQSLAVDGRKIPANANKESFHREATLARHHQEAAARVATLREQRVAARELSSVQKAARRRAARERQERLDAALQTVRTRQAERVARGRAAEKPEETRASETDSAARKMKRSHGGFEPAFNVQTATDVDSGLIVAVVVTAQASDNGLLVPLVEQATENLSAPPKQALVDAGYMNAEQVIHLEKVGIEVLMPPLHERKDRKQGKDPYARKRGDKEETARWRARMGTAAARARYGRRAPVAEGVHAQQSNRGWKRFRLRGLVKAQVEALWQALAHNLCVLASLASKRTEMLRLLPI